MQEIKTVNDLRLAIKLLEYQQENDLVVLKGQLKVTMDNLSPASIIKKSVRNMFSSSVEKSTLFDAAMGITSGIVAEKIVVGNSHNPITKLMGAAIKFLVTNKVVKNADEIKVIGGLILNKVMKKKIINEGA